MKVDFFIVGEPKSGTTALANFLAQHPEICMSNPKETGHFAIDQIKESENFYNKPRHHFITNKLEYEACFVGNGLKGEASTNYLFSKKAAEGIKAHNSNAKIIIMLRNPVDYLYSLHMQFVNETREDCLDFKKAIELQTNRKKGKNLPSNLVSPSDYQYYEWANYPGHIKRYKNKFKENQILYLINEEFRVDNTIGFKKVANFLGVDENFNPTLGTVHGSVTPRSKRLNKILNNPSFKINLMRIIGRDNYHKIRWPIVKLMMRSQQRQPLDPIFRKELYRKLKPNIVETSKLIGRDLDKIWDK